MRSARLLLDPPASGSWNMAVDQALLESVGKTGELLLRFYRWEEPTLSLGYFQSLGDRSLHPASLACPVVRRTTGGGAILHDREITYSVCVPSSNRWAQEHEQLYWTIHGCIIDELADWGLETRMYQTGDGDQGVNLMSQKPVTNFGQSQPESSCPTTAAFLCFQRRSKGDIVCASEKICGSAQRREQNSILQHGSLIFGRSSFAPELPGIDDLSNLPPIAQDRYLERLIWRIGNVLRVQLVDSQLTAEEQSRAKQLEPQFCSSNWLIRKGRLQLEGQ